MNTFSNAKSAFAKVGAPMATTNPPVSPTTDGRFGRFIRKVLIDVLVFYVAAWVLFTIGFEVWKANAAPCAMAAATDTCRSGERVFVPHSAYLRWRSTVFGDQGRRESLIDSTNDQAQEQIRNRRAKLVATLLSVYLKIQGNEFVRQADAIDPSCGGFYVAQRPGLLGLPSVEATPPPRCAGGVAGGQPSAGPVQPDGT